MGPSSLNMTSLNGLKDNWFNPPIPEGGFHNVVKQRLRDQLLQNWRTKIRSSARFILLNDLKSTLEPSAYIDLINNSKTPLIFTRLHIDMNVFSDYMKKKYTGTATCPLSNRGATLWRHQMETFSALQVICAGNSPPVNSTHKGQWRVFSLICTWINGWVNNREAGDLRRHRPHYDVIVMKIDPAYFAELSLF